MKQPLVSVIVPCYNYGNFLPEAVRSVQQQTYPHWECLIIDDGSTDNSYAVAKALAESDDRIRVFRLENVGLSNVRNTGLREAKGKFIQFLDADDLIVKNKFALEVELLQQNLKVDMVYGDFVLLENASGQITRGDFPKIEMREAHPFLDFCRRWEKDFSIPIHAFLFRQECFREVLFNPALPTHEDVDVHLRHSLRGFIYMKHDEKVAVYRVHAKSMARNVTRMHAGFLSVIHNLINLPGLERRFHIELEWRYTEEIFNAVFDKLRGKRSILRESLVKGSGLNLAGFVLLPVHAVFKLCRVIMNRARGGSRQKVLTGFKIFDE
ncbi:MAG TPA: glycosyltransferase family 2 protein [Bacteroidia bacterium]|nr:glycosyltransferase family 2 protein [Bacteroidia bacterium]